MNRYTNITWWNIENNTWTEIDIPAIWTDVQTWNNFTWWNIENWTWTEIETWDNQIEISDFYDIVYTWIASWWLFTITLMDRNLWATIIWVWSDTDEESYWYYYQWWNNHPFSCHKENNQYTNERVDASWYWPNNRFIWNKFIKWSNDWSTVSNNNLWWWEWDSEENEYNDGWDRQWPCPDGYHVPSVWEWHALFITFLANNGISEVTTSWLTYPGYIWKEKRAAYYLESEDIENFKETFNISYAWRMIGENLQRTWTTAHLWTSTPLNGESLWFEVWDDHINLWWWETVRTAAYPVRCFKSVEYEEIWNTVTFVDGENEFTESALYGQSIQEPLHTEKWTWYNWLWWYLSGSDSIFDFTGTKITWDITLIAKWECESNYHEENGLCRSNAKMVNCEQTWWVENSSYIVTWVIITWDTTWEVRSEIPACERECESNYHEENGLCRSNAKMVNCEQTWWVENSSYIVTWVIITWDTTREVRSEIPACERKCNIHYHKSWNACTIDEFNFTSIGNEHINTEWTTQSGKISYGGRVVLNAQSKDGYEFKWWKTTGLEWSGITVISQNNQIEFSMPDRDVTATPLSSPIEYNIIYNIDGATISGINSYNIETPDFTLPYPIKSWYTFAGWTWSNWNTPEINVTIYQWTTWNKSYYATWTPSTWTEYRVLHIRERADTSWYALNETEFLSWTTDWYTNAVAKEYSGFTLSGSVEQQVINPDWSTVVRIFYNRNRYTITFDTDGGSTVDPITAKYESTLTSPANPTKGGYIFLGWSPVFPSTMPLWWADLLAQWRRRSSWWSSSSDEIQITTGANETITGQNSTTWTIDEAIQETENLNIDAGTVSPNMQRSMMLLKNMLKTLAQPEQTRGVGDTATLLHGTGFNQTIKRLAGPSNATYNTNNTTIKQIIQAWSIPSWVITWLLSTQDSESPIYGWFDNGTIYYYTDAETVYLNQDSSSMFYYLQWLTWLEISNWDTSNVTNMWWMFEYCSSLENIDVSNWDTSNVTNMEGLFYSCSSLTWLNLNSWNTSNVTNMEGLFYSCSSLTWLNLNSWNTSNVNKMSYMFKDCSNLINLDISSWDTSNVTEMHSMFQNCSNLINLDVSSWDTSSVTFMSFMFYGCESLDYLDVSSWNTSNLEAMFGMFWECSSLTWLDLSNWDTSNVTNMDGVFGYCSNLNTIYASTWFVTTAVTNSADGMFEGCTSLVWWNGTTYDASHTDKTYARIDAPGTPWYFTKYTTTTFLPGTGFNSAIKSLAAWTTIAYSTTGSTITKVLQAWSIPSWVTTWLLSTQDSEFPIYGWFDNWTIYYYTQADKIYLNPDSSYMFYRLTNLTTIDMSKRDTSNVIKMLQMFGVCSNLTWLDLSNWDVSNVISMSNIFYLCAKLETINLNGWDTSNVTNMHSMFNGCSKLTGLDLRHFDTSKVTDMEYMFQNNSSLVSLNVSGWNTSSVKKMGYMFQNCSNFTSLNLSSFDTSSVTGMYQMFYGCSKLVSLDLSNFDTSNVLTMYRMFQGDTALTTLNIGSWNTSKVTNMNQMFYNDSKLVTIYASSWFIDSCIKSYKYVLQVLGVGMMKWNETTIDSKQNIC